MKNLGVMEIFYGKPWPDDIRLSYARWLKELQMGFYIYGPKADALLRKDWRNLPTPNEFRRYQAMREAYKAEGLEFGIILSPHGLAEGYDLSAKQSLRDKVAALCDLGLDYFGLFFDDMKSSPDLASRQLEIASSIQSQCRAKLIFCPSFYCFDPLLDMLFGDRPARYLEELGKGLEAEIEILWTGEQIISTEMTTAHLREVTELLRRKPFVCDNFYADDGPLNCNFLRLLPPTGRPREAFSEATHWAVNPMNQPRLSLLVLSALKRFLHGHTSPEGAFTRTIHDLVSPGLGEFIIHHAPPFAAGGLEALSDTEKQALGEELANISASLPASLPANFLAEAAIDEFRKWLNGYYAVDFGEMLEQSCFVG